MINIDLEQGMTGNMGGDPGVLGTEYGVITEYFYRLVVGADKRNKKIFYEIIDKAVERAEANLKPSTILVSGSESQKQ